MYERLKQLCKEKGTTVTQLCESVTGSSGNLATWKKGYMRSDYLVKVAEILGVTTDFLLTGENKMQNIALDNYKKDNSESTDSLVVEFLKRFEKLDFDDKLEIMNITAKKLKESA